MPDYTDQLIAGGKAEQANTFGEHAAAGAAQDTSLMLPGITIPLDYAQGRADWFREKMAEHLGAGMAGVVSSELQNTDVYQSLKSQMEGYVRDTAALRDADNNYTLLVGPANNASKAITKQQAVQGQLGFADDTDFEKQLSPKQSAALKKTLRDNPMLVAKTQAVALASKSFDDARVALVGATQAYNAVLTGQVIAGLKTKLMTAFGEREEIMAKIEKVQKYVGYVTTGCKVIAMAAGGGPGALLAPEGAAAAAEGGESALAVTNWGEKVKGYAEKGQEGGEKAEGAVGTAMQMYYQKDLDALNGKITAITQEVSVYEEIQAGQQILAAQILYQAASSAFATAGEKYHAAIEDRRSSYLQIARLADASLNGGKEDKKHDFIQQVLLYMETCREARSVVGAAQTAAGSATASLAAAEQSVKHRSVGYKTNHEAYAGELYENTGPDEKVMRRMQSLTASWTKGADAHKQKLDKQEQSAEKIMGSF